MEFIGRQVELAKLNAEYERDGSFVVIYGRRKVLEYCASLGEIYDIVVEDIARQARGLKG